MAHENKVLKSVNDHGGLLCVDIFARPDGTIGYEEYRRDTEDNRGWFPIGFHGHHIFGSAEEALMDAQTKVPWLADALQSQRHCS